MKAATRRGLWLVGLGAVLASTPEIARAQSAQVTLEIGETVDLDIGYARGVACDVPELVLVSIRTVNDSNVVTLLGRQVGSTLCRLGTDPYRPSIVIAVTVTPPQRA